MRDFPVFTTENGVGSLVLKEIPYNGTAYVTIQDSSFPTEFLHECLSFCKAVGAEKVYATGNKILESYPLYTAVYRMTIPIEMIPDTEACVFPVTEKTLPAWREIYNNKMEHVDNAAYMSENTGREMLRRGDGYYIHCDGKVLGIGVTSGDRIDCIASVVPGMGKKVVSALAHTLFCDRVVLDVASTNEKAIRLYETMGFIKTAEVSRWYKIL